MTKQVRLESTLAELGLIGGDNNPETSRSAMALMEQYESPEGYFAVHVDDLQAIPSALAAHVESLQSRWL